MNATKTIYLICCLLLVVGCEQPTQKKAASQSDTLEVEPIVPDPIRVLIVGDEIVGPLAARQWKARRDGEITIENVSVDEFVASDKTIASNIDVIFYPPSLLGELSEAEKIQPLPSEVWNSDDLDKNELLSHFRMSLVRFQNEAWAVPLGGSTFSLFCNRAVWEKAKTKPPTLWEDAEKRIAKLKPVLTDGQESGIDMPLAEGWAANTYLARLAPTIRHRGKLSTVFDRKTMKPLITGPTFVTVLEELGKLATKRSLELDPKSVFELASSGKSAIAITWPIRPEQDPESESDPIENVDLTILPLPGVEEWFDHKANVWNRRNLEDDVQVNLIGFNGLVASLPTDAPNELAAWEFLKWLPSKSISQLTLSQSPNLGPFRATHLGDVSRFTGDSLSIEVLDEYADVVSNCHERSLVLLFPRVWKHAEYMTALDEAVREFMSTDKSAKEALEEAAAKWEVITESVGRNRQVRALRRESG